MAEKFTILMIIYHLKSPELRLDIHTKPEQQAYTVRTTGLRNPSNRHTKPEQQANKARATGKQSPNNRHIKSEQHTYKV